MAGARLWNKLGKAAAFRSICQRFLPLYSNGPWILGFFFLCFLLRTESFYCVADRLEKTVPTLVLQVFAEDGLGGVEAAVDYRHTQIIEGLGGFGECGVAAFALQGAAGGID